MPFEKKTSDNHFFYFMIPNKGETKITVKAVCGEAVYTDEGLIRKVDVMNEDYILKDAGAIINWFDITEVEGHFSLNDTMGEIKKSEMGRAVLGGLMQKVSTGAGHGGFELSEEVMQMMDGFTVVRMINLAGTMAKMDIPKEKILELNAILNTIPKE